MLKTTREKVLLVTVVSLGLISFTLPAIGKIVYGPLEATKLKIVSVDRQIADLEVRVESVLQAAHEYEHAAELSLPESTSTASTLYQKWLIDMLEACGWKNAVVHPGRSVPIEELGNRLPFTIDGAAELTAIATFLHTFHTAPALHKITGIVIENPNSSPGSGYPQVTSYGAVEATPSNPAQLLRVSLTLEALSVTGASQSALPLAASGIESAAGLSAHWQERNWFDRHPSNDLAVVEQQEVLQQASVVPQQPSALPQASLLLIALVAKGPDREAWLLNKQTLELLRVKEAGSLQVGDGLAVVKTIDSDCLSLVIAGDSYVVELGRTVSIAAGMD